MSVPNAPLDGLGGWGSLGGADHVRFDGGRFGIRGWISYDDEWVEYLLDDGRWLCVEAEGGLRLSLWVDQAENPGFKMSDGQLVIEGVPYLLTERYTARWMAAGIAGLTGPGRVTVGDYEARGTDGLAALEDWGDGPELSLGRLLHPGTVILDAG